MRKSYFDPERVTSTGGYTDYRLSIDGQSRLIVEAKRIGLFELQRTFQNPDYANSFLYGSCGSDMQLLLRQCQGYCIACGIPYAVATTGEVWIVLVGFKYGVEWGKLRSFVFHSLEDVSLRFSEFYGLLSQEAVRKNSLEETFGSMVLVKPNVAIRPREHVSNYPDIGSIPERQLIEAYFDRFMGEMTRPGQDEMLEQCYVNNRQLDEFSQDLQQLLRYDAGLDEQAFPVDEIDEKKLEDVLDLQLDAETPRTILLVGNVGAGKTTFVHRFVKQFARPKRNICVIVDLINQVQINVALGRQEEQKLASMVLEKLASEFSDKLDPFDPQVLRGCFEVEMGRFKKLRKSLLDKNPDEYLLEEEKKLLSLSDDTYNHLVGYLKYMRKRRYKTWITFDNVDRGSDSYQEFVYAFAHRLSSETNSVTIITLREDTFLEAQEAGFLDVRSSDVIFRISAPEFRQVVSKRRKYVDSLIRDRNLPRPLKSQVKLIETLNWHINKLVLGDNDSIRHTITTFSLNNIRYGLNMLRKYYTSYYCTFHEIFQGTDTSVSANGLDFVKEQNRFIQAMMLANTWSYREDISDIFNVFSVDPLEQTSHFLILRILAYLSLERNTQSSRISIKYEKIRNDFVFLGYQKHHVNNAVRKLLYSGLVVSPNLPASPTNEAKIEVPDPIQKEMKIALSAKGLYYLKKIVSNTYYQTRVGEDTVWYNEASATTYIRYLQESINTQKSYTPDDLLQATEAREVFMQYLRRSLLEEMQAGNVRYTQKDWARLINDIVERGVFGEPVTQSIYVAEVDNAVTSERAADTPPVVLPASLLKKNVRSDNSNGAEQTTFLMANSEVDYTKAIEEAVASIGPMPRNLKSQRSFNIVRVLWALEVASRAGIGALRPARIALIIRNYGLERVEGTNMARFFREQKADGDFTHLWKESPAGHYSISVVGRDKLYSLLQQEIASDPQ